MSRSRTERGACAAAAIVTLGALLAGCSEIYYDRRDIYFDRRDSIALGAGDAIAANEIAQMVDPRPPLSANTNIAANGDKMQSAVERYRTNRVIQPRDPNNSTLENLQQAQAVQASQSTSPITGVGSNALASGGTSPMASPSPTSTASSTGQ